MDMTVALSSVVIILAMTAAAIPVIAFFTDRRQFHGYREVRADIRFLAGVLNGKVRRSENDLVIGGIHSGFPVEARVSNDDYRPALIARMLTPPLPLRFSVRPKSDVEGVEWRPVTVSDPWLSKRFAAFADDPELACFFLEDRAATKDLLQLCWSARNYVSMTAQQVELIEPNLPDSSLGGHCLDQIRAMARLVAKAQELPRGKAGAVPKVERKRHLLVRTMSAIAAVVAFAALLSTGSSPPTLPAATSVRRQTEGVLPQDASRIHALDGWRVAEAADFDPLAVEWLRGQGQTPSGRLLGNFSGAGKGHNVAYVLTGDDGFFRLVMLIGNGVAWDVKYPHIEVAGVVPKDRLAAADWVGGGPRTPEGDGLLIVLGQHDPTSGLVLFKQAGALLSSRPVDYRNLNLE